MGKHEVELEFGMWASCSYSHPRFLISDYEVSVVRNIRYQETLYFMEEGFKLSSLRLTRILMITSVD